MCKVSEETRKYRTELELDSFLMQIINQTGMQGAYERFQKMRDYAQSCLDAHPEEKCADVLDDLMPLLDAVCLKFERCRL